MTDMRKVSSGERMNIPAATWNAFIDSTHYTEALRRGKSFPLSKDFLPDGTYWVKNNSGEDVFRYGILGVDAPLFAPRDNPDSFHQRVIFKGVQPDATDHTRKFVVCQEPIKSGEVGRCWADGICPVRLRDDTPEDARSAGVITDDVEYLAGGASGAEIIWIDSENEVLGTTGIEYRWALIRLGPTSQVVRMQYTEEDKFLGPEETTGVRVVGVCDDLTNGRNGVECDATDLNAVVPPTGIFYAQFDGSVYRAFAGGVVYLDGEMTGGDTMGADAGPAVPAIDVGPVTDVCGNVYVTGQVVKTIARVLPGDGLRFEVIDNCCPPTP